MDKHTIKRVKRIVSLTIEDFNSYGCSTNESPKSLKRWLVDEILEVEGIEDLYTYQISMLTLDRLKTLDIVDLGFIMELLTDDDLMQGETSIAFNEVVL